MTFARHVAVAAFLCAGTTLVSAAAVADEPDNTIGCLHMSKSVSDALAANPQSPNFKEATDEEKAGRQFCMSGVYNIGIAHYSKALDLLGASKP